ncbi:MAG: aspartyl/asparaginyl beta-hydroxylase domain-containing protein [Tahibacter sp.]
MKALTTAPRRSFLAHFFDRFVDWTQRRIVAASLVGDHAVFDKQAFPWIQTLEQQWPLIRAELDEVLIRRDALPGFHEITPEVRTITTDRDWKTFMFLGYGMRSEPNLQRCPNTANALARIPGLRTAFYSILEPGKRIPLHRGPYNGVLRLHLGLIVPEPRERCWIRVGGELRTWNEGEALVIDDMYPHEVHNDTNGVRVVLFVDFDRPLRGWVRWLNRLILALAPLTPEIQTAKSNLTAWERDYYGQNPNAG